MSTSVPVSEPKSSIGPGPAASGSGANNYPPARENPARVVDGWMTVDGCKVARVPEPGRLAFHDRERRRCSERGSDQPSCTLQELVQAMEEAGGDAK